MSRASIAARSALVVLASAGALVGASTSAQAQRSQPRYGVLVEPRPKQPTTPYPGANVTIDPNRHARRMLPPRYPVGSNTGNAAVVYVVPVGSYGYPMNGYGVASYGYGGVYDVNGRPLSIGFDNGPSAGAVPSYTPDLTGSPYVVIEGGAIMVDMPNGERRTFASCAAQTASHDPDGHPRTVFYSGSADDVILREGQRGRVHGLPESGAKACYTIDSIGRVSLEY